MRRMREMDLTVERLAVASDLSSTTVRRMAKGVGKSHPVSLAAVARVLGCRPKDLVPPK
jgi:hypothetical protein